MFFSYYLLEVRSHGPRVTLAPNPGRCHEGSPLSCRQSWTCSHDLALEGARPTQKAAGQASAASPVPPLIGPVASILGLRF